MTNRWRTTFYTGSTSDIVSRITDHKSGRIDGFTKIYNLDQLVWFEIAGNMDDALQREKRVKRWDRDWKIGLIESLNPDWHDLYKEAKVSMAHVADY